MALATRTMGFGDGLRQLGRTTLAVLFLLVSASDVAGQQLPCGPRDQALKQLAAEYGEAPVASGVMGNGNLIELLTSPSGTWTILVTRPGGVSCLIATGEGWQDGKPLVPGRDA